MAWDRGSANDIGTMLATADLSTKQYYGVYFDSSGGVSLCAAAGARCDGILQNAPAAGQVAIVRPMGPSKAVASAAITVGALVKVDSAGKFVTASKAVVDSTVSSATDPVIGSNVLGNALIAAAADGDIITVNINIQGAVPTTAA